MGDFLEEIGRKFFGDDLFLSNKTLRERVAVKMEEDREEWAWDHLGHLQTVFAECRSPIEELFLFEFIKFTRVVDVVCLDMNEFLSERFGPDIPPCRFRPITRRWNDPLKPITVTPQAPIKKYKADFLISLQTDDGKTKSVCVECDGHDYHDRTKEQAQRDKARDRAFLSAGLITLRFTGGEIYKNTGKCVDEVLRFLVSKD